MTVRQATIADLDSLAPLFDAYRQFYRQPSNLDLARRILEEFAAGPSRSFLSRWRRTVPRWGSRSCIPAFLRHPRRRIFILAVLFVKPEARRTGAGSLLLDAAANFGRAVGAVRLTLSTELTNAAAQALYEAAGWTRQTDFYVYNLPLRQHRKRNRRFGPLPDQREDPFVAAVRAQLDFERLDGRRESLRSSSWCGPGRWTNRSSSETGPSPCR